jgi:CrcB protein
MARWGLARLSPPAGTGSFPWVTFVTNVTGSFLLGVVLTLLLERYPPTRYTRPFLATGFLGSYTTYSTFAVETDLLIRQSHVATAVVYALGSVAAGLLAVWAGTLVARAFPHPRGGGRP